jgi:uncharacterized protein YraI
MKRAILIAFVFFICTVYVHAAQARVTASALNVRSGPCTSYKVVATLSQGTIVTTTGDAKTDCGYTWWKISGSFGSGWAASTYLQIINSGTRKTNAAGVNLIKSFEGLYLCKYKDPVGLWTIW